MHAQGRIVLITGASGFLGQALCRQFSRAGYTVRALLRDVGHASNIRGYASGGVYRCELADQIDEEAFSGKIDALIHCAWDFDRRNTAVAEAVNVLGAENLVRLARKNDVSRFVFVSSLSAHDEARSCYGRGKRRVEESLDSHRDLIIRPGLIVGDGGLFAAMKSALFRIPVVPLFFGGNQQLQLVGIDDLCRAFEAAVGRECTGSFNIALPEPVPIRDFYTCLAKSMGKRCYFVRMPGSMALWMLRLSEAGGLHWPISSENLLGLRHMKTFDTLADLARLGIDPRLSPGDLLLGKRK